MFLEEASRVRYVRENENKSFIFCNIVSLQVIIVSAFV